VTTAQTQATRDQAKSRRRLLLATSLGFAVIQLDVSVVNVAVKAIGADLGGGVSDLQWVVSAYTVAFAALILTAGTLGDRLGAKRLFIAGFVLFTLASAACGLAPSLSVLIASRAVQGVGAAMLAPTSLTLLNHTFTEPGERARAVGLYLAGASTALAGGPLVAGVLTATLGWRAIFFINAPIGFVGILLTLRYATETSQSRERPIDLPGQLAVIIALLALAGATIEGGVHGFTSPGVLIVYAVALLAATAFLLLEGLRKQVMLPLALFRSAGFSASTAIGLSVNTAFYGLIFVLSLFFQRGQHLTALQTGFAFAPSTIAVATANILAGRADKRFGPRLVMIGGAALIALALAALLGVDTTSSYASMVIQLVLLGFGLGSIVPAVTAAMLASVDRDQSGLASGTLNSARQMGSVIGVSLFGALIENGHRLVGGLHASLAVSIGLALVICVIATKAPSRHQD
jgi:DHA2 family methylenomycin A resistance protein-like MFS transporter